MQLVSLDDFAFQIMAIKGIVKVRQLKHLAKIREILWSRFKKYITSMSL